MPSTHSPETPSERLAHDRATLAAQMQNLMFIGVHHWEKISRDHGARAKKASADLQAIMTTLGQSANDGSIAGDAKSYAVDAAQRSLLTLDVLRERGNNDLRHQAMGTPPVLIYDSAVAVDGRDLPRPVNYILLKIVPPQGVVTHDWKRPYMIIDPRAGHGAGIGGFKPDSQVGVALHNSHPVYFVVFRPEPEPGQTLADVVAAEAEFVAEIHRRHPDAPKPIIVGNCQGGWAALLLAASNPDITGPLVLNGAPVSTWSGRVGENPMRYNGGLMGGVLPAILTADLGNGVFDGAHLVSNFEKLNPGRNYFGKYYDLFANVEKSRESFLEFERWWGGYHYMNEAEIRWIVEQIFVGNRLSHGEARLEPGPAISLKAIRSPIIVFASKGDNITPPQQALNWIADTFADEHEIKVRGQRIIYMVHEKVGHLGIFVSSSIARKEHTEVTSTLKLIEALAPGLYEMSIDDQIGEGVDAHFHVSIHERKMSDIALFDDKRDDERSFGAVARLSEIGVEVYDQTVRPMIRAAVTAKSAEALRKAHPSRASRLMFADTNPLMAPVAQAARRIAETREKASQSNPFLPLEKFWAARVIDAFDLMRDLRDAALEASFFSIYGSPFMRRFGEKNAFVRTPANSKEMRFLPAVQAILGDIDRGGFAEAVIRMMILLAHSRGAVRRDRLEHSSRMLTSDAPFAALGDDARAKLIFDQSIIVEFELERAFETLPDLLPDSKDRRLAMVAVRAVAGAVAEMDQATVATFQRFAAILGLENPSNDGVSTDLRAAAPLAAA